MPWTEESPLAAGLGFAANYLQSQTDKKRQDLQDKLAQEQEDRTAAYQQAQMKQMADQEQDRRTTEGIDPTTGQRYKLPPALTAPLPPNHGNQQIADSMHLNRLLAQFDAYLQGGYTGPADAVLKEASLYSKDIAGQQALDKANERMAQAMAIAQLHAATSVETTGMRDYQSGLNAQTTAGAHIQGDEITHAGRSAGNTAAATVLKDVTSNLDKMRAANVKTEHGLLYSPNTKDPLSQVPYPNLGRYTTNLQDALQTVRTHPERAQSMIRAITADKNYNDEQKQFAIQSITQMAQSMQDAGSMTSQAAGAFNQSLGRGSNASGNPQYPGP